MALTALELAENDQRFLLDFHSLGASAHEYTATALYHEAQRVCQDANIPHLDKPRIQTVLGAKMFAEAVASIETVGKLLNAIRMRHPDGIACRYVNGTEAHSEQGLRLFRSPAADLLGGLGLPSDEHAQEAFGGRPIKRDCESIRDHCHRLYKAYLDPRPDGRERKSIVEAYRAIKHGSNILSDPRKVSIWPIDAEPGRIWMITRWPRKNEGREQLEVKEVGLDQDRVTDYIEICHRSSVVCSNLCLLVIALIRSDLLTYSVLQS